MPGLFDDILNQDGGNQVLIDKSGRFDKLNPNFQNQILGLANDFYTQYKTPLILTDTYRTQSEQADAHIRKPSLALPAGPYAKHPMGLAIDIDQNQAKMIDPQLLSNYGLGLPAINKGETWHIEPVVRQVSNTQQSGLFDDVLSQPKPQPGKVQSIPEMLSGPFEKLGVQPRPEMEPPKPSSSIPDVGTSESLNMFQIPFQIEPETVAGTAAGFTPRGISSPLTGLAIAGAGAVKRSLQGKAKQETYSPEDYALMQQGLPAVSNEMLKDFGFGAGLDYLTNKTVGVAGKLMGGVKGEIQSVIDWARSKNIPYPADIAGSKLGKLAENLPDIGLGGNITKLRRYNTANKLTEAVNQVADEVGLTLKPAAEVGQDVAEILHGLVSGSGEHTALKQSLAAMDQSQRFPMNSLKETLITSIGGESSGRPAFEQIGLKKGLDALEKVYGKRGSDFVDAVKEIVENDFTASPSNLNTLIDMVNLGIQKTKKGWNDPNISRAKGMADKLKQGFVSDMEGILTPSGQNLSALYQARNKAYSEAMGVIDSVNPQLKLLYKPNQMSNKLAVTLQEANFENMADRLFRPGFEKQANQLKDTLVQIGREDVWDTAKMAWIKKVFDNSMITKGEETFFSPTKYKAWYDANKEYIGRMMPEQAPVLKHWNDVSNAFEADMNRFASSGPRGKLGQGLSAAGALSSYFGIGGTLGVAVPQSASFLSALSVLPGAVRIYLPGVESMGLKTAGQMIKAPAIEKWSQ